MYICIYIYIIFIRIPRSHLTSFLAVLYGFQFQGQASMTSMGFNGIFHPWWKKFPHHGHMNPWECVDEVAGFLWRWIIEPHGTLQSTLWTWNAMDCLDGLGTLGCWWKTGGFFRATLIGGIGRCVISPEVIWFHPFRSWFVFLRAYLAINYTILYLFIFFLFLDYASYVIYVCFFGTKYAASLHSMWGLFKCTPKSQGLKFRGENGANCQRPLQFSPALTDSRFVGRCLVLRSGAVGPGSQGSHARSKITGIWSEYQLWTALFFESHTVTLKKNVGFCHFLGKHGKM